MNAIIFDNGGKTDDRYCVIFDKGNVFSMTADPLSPGGVRYLCEVIDLDTQEAGILAPFEELPKALIEAIAITGRILSGIKDAA